MATTPDKSTICRAASRGHKKTPLARGQVEGRKHAPRNTRGKVRIAEYALTATGSCTFLSTVTFRLQRAKQFSLWCKRANVRVDATAMSPNGRRPCVERLPGMALGVVRSPTLWLNR